MYETEKLTGNDGPIVLGQPVGPDNFGMLNLLDIALSSQGVVPALDLPIPDIRMATQIHQLPIVLQPDFPELPYNFVANCPTNPNGGLAVYTHERTGPLGFLVGPHGFVYLTEDEEEAGRQLSHMMGMDTLNAALRSGSAVAILQERQAVLPQAINVMQGAIAAGMQSQHEVIAAIAAGQMSDTHVSGWFHHLRKMVTGEQWRAGEEEKDGQFAVDYRHMPPGFESTAEVNVPFVMPGVTSETNIVLPTGGEVWGDAREGGSMGPGGAVIGYQKVTIGPSLLSVNIRHTIRRGN